MHVSRLTPEIIEARTQEARTQEQAWRDQFDELLARGPSEELCGEEPRECDGRVTIGDTWFECPLQSEDCPHRQARQDLLSWMLLDHLRFGREALRPAWDRVPDGLRKPVEVYCDTIGQRIAHGDGLTLGGAVGAGKTCCLALIALAVRRAMLAEVPDRDLRFFVEKLRIEYISALKLFNVLHEGARPGQWSSANVLLLDDLGTEYRASVGFALSRFQEIIDDRWQDRLPTVISTNLSKRELAEDPLLGRIWDRLKQRNPYVLTTAGSQRPEAQVSDWLEEADGA